MTVNKIESMEWHSLEDRAGDGIIKIELRDLFEPYLLGTSYCNRIVVWWDSRASAHDEAVCIYAIEETSSNESGPFVSKVESWHEPELTEAIKWVQANLT